MVVSMKLVTPAMGTLELSADKQPELFSLAKVALGSLGVVAEVTLQCVPAHRLVERTWVATRQVQQHVPRGSPHPSTTACIPREPRALFSQRIRHGEKNVGLAARGSRCRARLSPTTPSTALARPLPVTCRRKRRVWRQRQGESEPCGCWNDLTAMEGLRWQEVVANHAQLLREYQHIRFM
jgi:hypothetical protein